MSDFDLFGEPALPEPANTPVGDAANNSDTEDMFNTDDVFAAPSGAVNDSYVVVARRYRPQTFAQLVGQEHIQQALSNAISAGQIGHAYLFSGPRGTGKTSTARILAKSLNCQNNGPRPDPCGVCESCRSITAGNSLDVLEIDAASNTGVDNIRDLRSGVSLAPFSRYKVYIVDEVHMLSTQAFNALLKTLEEPPSQVVFVLATTDPQKVPETIVSRCQRFSFRRFTTTELESHLGNILDTELAARGTTVSAEDRTKILELIAQNADGGMRDAQVSLDQVLVLAKNTLDYETVRHFLGAVESSVMDSFVLALRSRDAASVLNIIDSLVGAGQDLERFVKSMTSHIRNILVAKSAPHNPELLNLAPDRHTAMVTFATALPMAFLLNTSNAFLDLLEKMKQASQARFLLEITALRLATVDAVEDIDNLITRLQQLENALKSAPIPMEPHSGGGTPSPQTPQQGPPPTNNTPPPTAPATSRSMSAPQPAQEKVQVCPQAHAAAQEKAPAPTPAPVAPRPTVKKTEPIQTEESKQLSQSEQRAAAILAFQRQKLSGKVLTGEELLAYMENNPEVKEYFNAIKTQFDLADDNFSFRYH